MVWQFADVIYPQAAAFTHSECKQVVRQTPIAIRINAKEKDYVPKLASSLARSIQAYLISNPQAYFVSNPGDVPGLHWVCSFRILGLRVAF
jgi:hypothetical protein